VADALAYAHSLGVVHRDIKPANLLIDQAGTIWISDFGLARLETAATLTGRGDLLGTLRYLSPELARGDHTAVNARTDIYALGVTLYELLTLEPAFDGANREQLLRQINDQEPRPPRRINPVIPADLETIVLKAMSKDAASRYPTAQEMAEDLRRYLEHKPILARRPTIAERAGKWARRHVALISTGAAALMVATISLLIAALMTLQAYNSEAQHRAAAVANLRVASDSIDRMLSRVADDRYFHGDLGHAETVAVDATKFYEKLLDHSDDPDLRLRAAEAHEQIAEIWVLIGHYEKARAACRRSIELLQPLIRSNFSDGRYLNARGAAYLMLNKAEWGFAGSRDAEEPCAQAVADFRLLVDRFPHEPKYQGSLSNALNNLGLVLWIGGRDDDAERCFEQSIEILDRMSKAELNTPQGWTTRAGTLCNWAIVVRARGDTKRAMQLLEEAISLQKRSLDEWPTNPVAIEYLFNHYWHLGETGIRAGQHAAAATAVETLVWAFPNDLQAFHFGAVQLLQCAELAESKTADAKRLSDSNSVGPADAPSAADRTRVAAAYRQRAHELVAKSKAATSRTPEALNRFAWFLLTYKDHSLRDAARALEMSKEAVTKIPERSSNWLTLALACYRAGDLPAAKVAVEKSIARYPGGNGDAFNWLVAALIEAKLGNIDKARQWYTKAADCCLSQPSSDPNLVDLANEAQQLMDADDAVQANLSLINN
jgi:tetratricopeptide (TPR) repeat protein